MKSRRKAALLLAVSLSLIIIFKNRVIVIGQNAKPVLVALNKADSNLSIIDPTDMKVVGKVPVGNSPHEVVLSVDGKTAFVANYGDQTPGSSLSVIDIASQKELRRVDLAPLMRPHGLVELGGKIYFTAETNRLIARYDPATNRVDWMMGTGQNLSHMLVASSDQKRFFTTNLGSDSITSFSFQSAPPSGSKIVHIQVGKQPEAIDLSPDGKEVWVGLNVDLGIDIVDAATEKVTSRIKLGERPYRVRFTPDGATVVATLPGTKELVFIEPATRKETRRTKVDGVPLGIVFSKDSKTAFVTTAEEDAVLKVDVGSGKIVAKIAGGKIPDGIAVAGF